MLYILGHARYKLDYLVCSIGERTKLNLQEPRVHFHPACTSPSSSSTLKSAAALLGNANNARSRSSVTRSVGFRFLPRSMVSQVSITCCGDALSQSDFVEKLLCNFAQDKWITFCGNAMAFERVSSVENLSRVEIGTPFFSNHPRIIEITCFAKGSTFWIASPHK